MRFVRRLIDGTWLEPFARWGVHRTGTMLLFGLGLLAFGIWGVMRLGIDQDLKALIPRDSPSIQRLDRLAERMGAQTDFIVQIDSPSREKNLEAGKAIVARMSAMPEFLFVQFHRDLAFFKKNALLFLPIPDLLEMRKRLIDRIKTETAGELIEDVDGAPKPKDPPKADNDLLDLDLKSLSKRYLGENDVPGEYMEADEGRILVIKARPTKSTTDVEFTQALVDKVKAAIAEVGPASFHPEMKVTIQGEYQERVAEASGLRKDVLATGLFEITTLFLVTWAYYRKARSIHILYTPVIISTLLVFAVGAIYYGKFNLVTTFIFAVLLGLGEDFVTYTLARYSQEKDSGKSTEEALRIALVATGNPTAIGAATTVASFFMLGLGHFKGFSQFGIVGGTGVVLTLLTAFALMPALVVGTEKLIPWKPRPIVAQRRSSPSRLPTGRTGIALAVSILAVSVGVALFGIWKAPTVGFEYDFTKLGTPDEPRPTSQETPRQDYNDAVGRVTTFAPAVALCADHAECADVTKLFMAIKRTDDGEIARLRGERPLPKPAEPEPEADPDDPFAKPEKDRFADLAAALDGGKLLPDERALIARLGPERVVEMRYFLQAFLALQMFVPDRQEEKLQIIADMRQRLDDKVDALKPKTREKVDKYRKYLDVDRAATLADVPSWAKFELRDSDGEYGRFIILWNRGAKADYADSKRLHTAFFDLPVAQDKTVPVAANYFVLVETMEIMWSDAPVVFFSATGATILLILLLYRSLFATAVIASTVAIALGWLAAWYAMWDWKLNMFSVVAFPLLFGMGSDYPIQLYSRWKEEGGLWIPLRETGGALFFAAGTTVLGFVGLFFADHIGIQSLGMAASLGIAFSWAATMITLPAVLYLVDRSRGGHRPGQSRTA